MGGMNAALPPAAPVTRPAMGHPTGPPPRCDHPFYLWLNVENLK